MARTCSRLCLSAWTSGTGRGHSTLEKVQYPPARATIGSRMAQLAPDEIPRDARELAELLASRLDVFTGRLELIYVDGRYVDGYKQKRMKQERMKPELLASSLDVFTGRIELIYVD